MTAVLAAVAVRGVVKAPQDIRDTLSMLHLRRQNYGVVLKNTPAVVGMLVKVKDYIAWGELDDATLQELIAKRGMKYRGRLHDAGGKYHYAKILAVGDAKYKKYFRLNPPRKGFGRKGIKVQFAAGGALGYRGDKINDLIRRML